MGITDKAKDAADKLKDATQKGIKNAKGTVDNAKDAVDETMHRTAADAEKTRRESEGDDMTASEKVQSFADETKNRAQAEIDAAKRGLRKNT
jgi:hypothetical protein